MERKNEMQSIGSKLLELILKECLEEIQDYFWKYRTLILESFQEKVRVLCKNTYELQKNNQKESVQFFSISYFRHCVYTKKHEIRMDFYNKNFYLDHCKVYEYWDMGFLFQFFEKDMEYLWKQIRSTNPPLVFQVQEYEEKEFALWYVRHYYKLAELFFCDQIRKGLEQEEFHLLKKEENFIILYGGYMEEQSILFSAKGGELE